MSILLARGAPASTPQQCSRLHGRAQAASMLTMGMLPQGSNLAGSKSPNFMRCVSTRRSAPLMSVSVTRNCLRAPLRTE